jgi:hypothetical protein
MQGFVLTPWTTARSAPSIASFTQDEEEWIDLGTYGDCAFWVDVSELTNPTDSGGATVPVKLVLETAPIPDETLFRPVAAPLTLAAKATPTILKSVRTPTTAPLSRWVRWRLDATGAVNGTWSSTFRIRAVPGKSSFFNPSEILGCQLWLRGDLGITFNGSAVSGWADQSGNGNNASQGTPAQQPQYSATAMNGFPAIHSDGAAGYMSTSSFTLGSDATLIVATQASSTTQGNAHRLLETGYDTAYFLGGGATTPTTIYKLIVNNSVAPYGLAEGGTIATSNQIVTGVYNSSTTFGTLYVNGAQVGQDVFTAPASVSKPMFILTDAFGFGGYWNGYIGEVLVYNRALTSAELRRIHKYLGNRYGISV